MCHGQLDLGSPESRSSFEMEKHTIEECELGGGTFDRIKDNILGEVKADYGFAQRVGWDSMSRLRV